MNDDTNGSLDTNVRLLAQRLAATETHLNRLGDSVRVNSTNIHKIEAQMSKNDELLTYRLDQITCNQKETSSRYWGLASGLVVTFLIAIFDLILKRN